MSEDIFSEEELETAIHRCPEWEVENDTITRTLEFEEFMDAIDFVNVVADISEDAQHFPDMEISETTVTLVLTTKEVSGVTEADIELAIRIDNVVE